MSLQVQPSAVHKEQFINAHVAESSAIAKPQSFTTCNSTVLPLYTISPIELADREEVVQFLRRFFFKDEPLNLCTRLISEECPVCPNLEEYALQDLDSGFNVKAVSKADGRIIGISLNDILKRGYLDEPDDNEPDMNGLNGSNATFDKIKCLLERVARESDIFGHYPHIDKALMVRILSVDGAWRGQGIARELVNYTRQLAKRADCKLITVDCTSHFTARAVEKLGFKCIYTLNYADYLVDGKVVFEPEYPHKAVTVYTQIVD